MARAMRTSEYYTIMLNKTINETVVFDCLISNDLKGGGHFIKALHESSEARILSTVTKLW